MAFSSQPDLTSSGRAFSFSVQRWLLTWDVIYLRGVHNSGERSRDMRDVALRQPPNVINDHGNLDRQGGQGQTGSDIVKALNRELFMSAGGAHDFGNQIKQRFNRGAALSQKHSYGRRLEK